MYFALGPDRAVIPEAGAARERLLAWVAQCERERGVSLKEILWDGAGTYWVEVQGERVQCSQALAPLEFGA